MAILDAIALVLVSGLILYNIKRTDHVDSRLDVICERMTRMESYMPKRKSDRNYYSENSGIEL